MEINGLKARDLLIAKTKQKLAYNKDSDYNIWRKELKEKLKLDKDVAILKRIRKGYDVNDNLIEYTINYYDANLYTYKVEVAQIEKVK